MPDLFISYSRRDSAFGRNLHTALKDQQRAVWMDWEDILPTAEWWRAICEGIEQSDNFVFLLSPDSLGSVICNLEIEYARLHHKRIIPILFRDIDEKQLFASLTATDIPVYVQTLLGDRVLERLVRENWQSLARHNWVTFRADDDFETQLRQLSVALDTDIGHVRQHTRLLVQGLEWQNNERNWSFLLFGEEITAAETWLAAATDLEPAPTDLQREYIAESRKADTERTEQAALLQRRARQFRIAAIVLAVIGSLSLIAALLSGVTVSNALTDVQNAQGTLQNAQGTLQIARGEIESLRLGEIALDYLQPSQLNAESAALLSVRGLSKAYSPQADAALIRAVDQLYSLRTFLGHTAQVEIVAFSPDGRQITSTGENSGLRVWDAITGEQVYLSDRQITAAVFMPDGSELLTIGRNGIGILNPATNDFRVLLEVSSSLGSLPTYRGLSLLDDGRTAALITPSEFQLFDLDTQAIVRRFPLSSPQAVTSANGERILLHNDVVELYELQNDEPLRQFEGAPPLALSPDGKIAATHGDNNTVLLWNADTGDSLGQLVGHQGALTALAFSPDGRWLATGSQDTTTRLWDWQSGEMVRLITGNLEGVRTMAWSPDSRWLLTGGLDRTIRLWDVTPSSDQNTLLVGMASDWRPFFSIANPVPGTTTVAAAYNIKNESGGTLVIRTSARSADRRWAVSGHDFDMVAVWQGGSDQPVYQQHLSELRERRLNLTTSAIAPDNRIFAMAAGSSVVNEANPAYPVYLFDVETGNIQRTIETAHESNILNMNFSSNGALLVTASADNTARLWDVNTGELRLSLRGHTGRVTGALFSPDDAIIFTRSDDGTLRLWKRETGDLLRVIPVTGVERLFFDDAGRTFVTADANFENQRRWHLDYRDFVAEACGRLRRDFSAPERIEFAIDDDVPTCNMSGTEQITPTPIITATLRQGTPLPTETYTHTPTLTPTSTNTVTATPTLTPEQDGDGMAIVGENRGEIVVGGGQIWFYAGQADEIITVRVLADHPANGVSAQDRVKLGLFDTRLILRDAHGVIIAENDDAAQNSDDTNSAIVDFRLPFSDFYSIEVRGFNDMTGGAYTLTIESSKTENE